MSTNKLKISQENRNAILIFLNRFGWLTLPMLAKLVWPNASQSTALARRTVLKLVEEKKLIKRSLTPSIDCYTLGAAGAAYLKEQLGIAAESGAKLQLKNPIHRACGNWYLIEKIIEGEEVWTEFEIQTGRAPIKTVLDKIPDALVKTEYGYIWIEVENSWKNQESRRKILHFSNEALKLDAGKMNELAPDFYIFRVLILSSTVSALQAITRTYREHYAKNSIKESVLNDIFLCHSDLPKNLSAPTSTMGSLWYEGVLPF